ncbi:MAG: hypothetical protein WDW38_003693 [Sanguina aurantia]
MLSYVADVYAVSGVLAINIAAAVVVGALVVWYLFNPFVRFKYRHIPGPLGWPVIGNLLEFAVKGQPQLCHELTPKYGKVFKFWFGTVPHIVINDPEAARKLSLRFNTRPGFDSMNVLPHAEQALAKKGLFSTTDMSLWRIARRAFDSSLLLPPSLAMYTPTMDNCVLRLINKLEHVAETGETVDMWRELGDMTMEVVGECAYG